MSEPRSKLRSPDAHEIDEFGKVLGTLFAVAIEKIGHDQLFRNCTICKNFTAEEQCTVYHARPPAKVIVLGCDSFADRDEIPF